MDSLGRATTGVWEVLPLMPSLCIRIMIYLFRHTAAGLVSL